MDSTPTRCGPRARCRKWKTCPACAKIRQAQFADRAEAAAKQMTIPTFYVLVPDEKTPAGIEYARAWFARTNRPAAGVWSIESGKFQAGYHLNVIAEWSETEKAFKGHIYREPIYSSVRAVAAYMTKAERAATKEEGFARQTGNLGSAADWLKKAVHEAPIVAAAAHQHDIDPNFLPSSSPGPETAYLTARRWLDALYLENEKNPKPKKRGRTI